jgi:hypothetical protein
MNLASKRRVRDWHSALGVALSGFSTSLDVIDAGVEGTGISCNGMPNPSFVELLLTRQIPSPTVAHEVSAV